MKTSRLLLDLARTAVAVLAAFYVFSVIPLYGAPFNGCNVSGYMTLQAGCSAWPEFLRGFLPVAGLTLAPAYLRLPLIALVVALVVAYFGGLAAINAGSHLYDNIETIAHRLLVFYRASPVFFGGAAAYLLYLYGSHFLDSNVPKTPA